MIMPELIAPDLLAPCGVNCAVCYKFVGIRKTAKPCCGCRRHDSAKPAHCLNCKIKLCITDKQLTHCHECSDYPCKQIKALARSYRQRYGINLVTNGDLMRKNGIEAFLRMERERWTCKCGGVVSLNDAQCSQCGKGID